MNENIKNNIILIGFMGCGKTSIGKELADRLSYQFLDSDHMIEAQTGDTISNIFQKYGEEYFRNLETELIKSLKSNLHHTVLSTGGGLPVKPVNAEILKEIGYVVHLKASRKTILKRLKNDRTRPLLAGGEMEEKVDKLLLVRTPLYDHAADDIINTDELPIKEITDLILEDFRKNYNTN